MTVDGLSPERERHWRRRLGRIRLGVEPVEAQLSRYRVATVTLSAVLGVIGLVFLALFTAFGRPDIGAGVVAVLLGPIAGLAWLDYRRLSGRVAEYRREVGPGRDP